MATARYGDNPKAGPGDSEEDYLIFSNDKRQVSSLKSKLRQWQCAFFILLVLAIAASLTMGLLYYYKDSGEQIIRVTDKEQIIRVTDPPTTRRPPPSGEYQYAKAAVSTDAGQCSEIGRDMLKKGGSAADAAISALLCVGLHNAHSAGIGGGFFMLHYNARTRTVDMLDAREVAPQAAHERMYENETEDASTKGGLAVAVPGEIAGYWMAHQRYGILPWSDLFQPSIALAEDGFVVQRALARVIKLKEKDIRSDSSMREVFVNSTGGLYREGDTIRRPRLAATYRKIAKEGADTFYKGSLADDIIADITDKGGIITKEDLGRYQVRRKTPLRIKLKGWDVYSNPPPGSGAVFSLIMNILEEYGLGPDSIATPEAEILATHRIVEAFKFAYAGRSFLGDEDFLDIEELVANMTSKSYAATLRAAINDTTSHDPSYYKAYYNQPDSGTSHMSAVDQQGNAVSVTSTINLYLGAKLLGNRTGILFNDEMDDFSKPGESNAFNITPSVSNFIVPGKRPMSSMTPVIAVDAEGQVRLAVGASGGSRITTGVAQVSIGTMWYGLSIKDAIQRKRIHHQLQPNVVTYEPGYDQVIINGLKAKGNHPKESTSGCVVVGILRDAEGYLNAYSDDRKGGYPAGI